MLLDTIGMQLELERGYGVSTGFISEPQYLALVVIHVLFTQIYKHFTHPFTLLVKHINTNQ